MLFLFRFGLVSVLVLFCFIYVREHKVGWVGEVGQAGLGGDEEGKEYKQNILCEKN